MKRNKSFFRRGVKVIILSLLFGLPSVANSATIFLNPGDSGFSNKKVFSNWEFLGFIGDYISLPDGEHNLNFSISRGYTLYIKILVQDNQVEVLENESRPGNGVTTYQVTWPKPTAEPHAEFKNIMSITFSPVKFGAKTGTSPEIHYMMAGCTKRKVILKVSSVPEGAEIWIDGKKQKYTTNATLSVPYCTYETTKRLVVRIPQRINYIHDFELNPNKKIEVMCELKKPAL
jgi:hypothetical protein